MDAGKQGIKVQLNLGQELQQKFPIFKKKQAQIRVRECFTFYHIEANNNMFKELFYHHQWF